MYNNMFTEKLVALKYRNSTTSLSLVKKMMPQINKTKRNMKIQRTDSGYQRGTGWGRRV